MNGTVDFVIPINKEDLIHVGPPGQYVVEQTFTKHELPGKLREAYAAFTRQGPSFILSHFDVLFSSLWKFGELGSAQQADAWKVVTQAMQQLNADLDKHFGFGNNDNDQEMCHELVTITKMTVYLLCSLLNTYETRNLAVPGSSIKAGRKKTTKSSNDGMFDLEGERNFVLVSLDQLIQMPINKLWSPPVVEQEFVNLIANVCYKVLENPVISHVRMKGTRESVFRVIGGLVKKYNHSLSCTLKIIQLLQHFEHAVSTCASGLVTLVQQFSCGSMVVDLVREIGRVDPRDLARDTSSSRNYAGFLTDLAEKMPAAFIPCISLLSVHLEEESPSMRNSVLAIFAEIVMEELSGENLDEKKRDLRDQLLEPLLEHLHDVNSFVRSKTLQLWHKMCLKPAIPLSLQHKVLTLTAGRLRDKTCTVRKNAIQLLIALMQSNPYSGRLPLAELENTLKTEQIKLDELIKLRDKDKPEKPRPNAMPKCGPTRAELWNAMEPEVLVAIQEILDESNEDHSVSELTNEEVIKLFNEGNYKKVIRTVATEERDGDEILDHIKTIYIGDEDPNEKENREKLLLEAIEEERAQEVEPAPEDSREIIQQRMLVHFLQDSQAFAGSVHDTIPVVCQLLCSKQTSDILEAIEFFVTAFEFEVSGAINGVKRMLSLVWSSEADVKQAVVDAYKRLYMNLEVDSSSKKKAVGVVTNLTSLISCSTQGELASLEELVSLCVKSGDLPKLCIQVMWERFSMTLPETTEEASRSALMLLAMVATADVQVVTSNVNVLISVGLGERGANDFRLAHLTCAALLKMAPTKVSSESQEIPMRFSPTHKWYEIFERTSKLLIDGLTRLEDSYYCQFAPTAVSLIYTMAEHPDAIMGEVLKKMCAIAYSRSQELTGTGESGEIEIAPGILVRILVISGQIAIKQLIHLDVHVYSELRRRARVREEKKEASSKKRRNLAMSASRRAGPRASVANDVDTADEDEIVGAVADDDEAEYVRKVCESEVVTGNDSFLSLMVPLVVTINSNPSKYSDPALRAAASICLAEFMLVSHSFCEKHLQLLFTVLERSPEEVIRSNLVIALGDLNFRFPNLIEPWTPRLYGRLRDDSPIVKRTTLNVLTHLILNDMVKVKGQISDIALCIIDPDQRISSMSRMFFTEFSRKANALYNVMPDIISRLCDPEAGVDEDDFQTIMKWVMNLIQKEKQSESLVEKIILRLGASRTERHSRDLVFCLSLLTFNERSLRRILEHWNCIADKIHELPVSEAIINILSNAKKLAKQETRALIEEIEAKLAETLEADEDEQHVVRKAQAAVAAKTPSKSKAAKSKKKAQKDSSSGEDISVDDEEESETELPATKAAHPAHVVKPNSRTKQPRSGRKKTPPPPSSEDEDENEDANESRKQRPSRSAARSAKRPVMQPSDSEEDIFLKPTQRSKGANTTKSTEKETTKRSTRARR